MPATVAGRIRSNQNLTRGRPIGYVDPKVPKPLVSPTLKDIYWIAGFLEGEGTFFGQISTCHVRAVQVQRAPLERLQKLLGGSIKPHGKNLRPNHSPAHVWSVSGARALGVILTIFPLMSPKRKTQIRIALGKTHSLC